MEFTAPYVIIEGAYLVPRDSSIRSSADVDRDGVRVVVGAGSVYDLYLSRELKRAQLVRAPTSPVVVDTMVAQKMDVAAGVKQQLEADSRRVSDVRMLEGRFMVIEQAMATPKGRPDGARYLAGVRRADEGIRLRCRPRSLAMALPARRSRRRRSKLDPHSPDARRPFADIHFQRLRRGLPDRADAVLRVR
jgi:hypothetical protein